MAWCIEHPIVVGLIAGVLFELLTMVFRFGFKLKSSTHTRLIANFTLGYRVHHGYPGLGLLMVSPVVPSSGTLYSIVLITGLMLFLSDLLHHSIVLPLFVGHHEFDLKYPNSSS